MPRVIQTSTTKHNFHSHFALHRGPGKYSSDPYSNRSNIRKKIDTIFKPRCSSTLQFNNEITRSKLIRILGFSSTALLVLLLSLSVLPVALGSDEVEAAPSGTASNITVTADSLTAN
ncbi:hypothetical protein IJG27_04875, partial [Candidatus Saccharibacteria bacterium]|nr:hypothetical protein [Candidatus Saccharibacteria bacterium]